MPFRWTRVPDDFLGGHPVWRRGRLSSSEPPGWPFEAPGPPYPPAGVREHLFIVGGATHAPACENGAQKAKDQGNDGAKAHCPNLRAREKRMGPGVKRMGVT